MPQSSSTRGWEKVRVGVWRLRDARLRFTVSRTLARREWVWIIERTNGIGHTCERARGRTYLLRQAKQIAPSLLAILGLFEREHNERRYIPGGRSQLVEET